MKITYDLCFRRNQFGCCQFDYYLNELMHCNGKLFIYLNLRSRGDVRFRYWQLNVKCSLFKICPYCCCEFSPPTCVYIQICKFNFISYTLLSSECRFLFHEFKLKNRFVIHHRSIFIFPISVSKKKKRRAF